MLEKSRTVLLNACEYPTAFQLFPVIQNLKNSIAVHKKGADKIAYLPNRLSKIENNKLKNAGKKATIKVAQNNKKYANGAGKLAYVIGACVSHQQVPKKKSTPKIQPKMKEPRSEFFSLFMAKNNGTRASHARNQNSKPGNARIKRIADKIVKRTFTGAGIFSLIPVSSFIRGQFNKINLTEQFNQSEINRSD